MKYRLRDVVDQLDYEELMKIKSDLESGGIHLKNFIESKIREKEKLHDKFCSVCQSEISPYAVSNFTLVFGPNDFRKKATFCALDCLKYFISNMEKFKKECAIAHQEENKKRASEENNEEI